MVGWLVGGAGVREGGEGDGEERGKYRVELDKWM